MRHAFRHSQSVQDAVRAYVRSRVEGVTVRKFGQEPNYTAALAFALDGTAYDGALGFVRFEAVVANDRGRNSAENRTGIDLALTAEIADESLRIRKAIVLQAKKGDIRQLDADERERLEDQLRTAKKNTRAPKVLELPDRDDGEMPHVIAGNAVLAGRPYVPTAQPDYFVRRVLTTLDGDTRQGFVASVQESAMPQLRLEAEVRSRRIR